MQLDLADTDPDTPRLMSVLSNNRFRNALGKYGALLGLLAILLGQLALAAHDLVVDHAEEDEESCIVCHLSDRQDHVSVQTDAGHPLPGAASAPVSTAETADFSNAPLDLSARGPPRYL